jgi:hypothetical protein
VNRFVIERFLDSFFKFDQIVRIFDEKHLVLVNLKLHFDRIENQTEETHKRILEEAKAEIRPQALRRSIYVGIVTGIIAGILTGIPLVYFGWWLAVTFPAPASAPVAQVISTSPMSQTNPAPAPAPPAP